MSTVWNELQTCFDESLRGGVANSIANDIFNAAAKQSSVADHAAPDSARDHDVSSLRSAFEIRVLHDALNERKKFDALIEFFVPCANRSA